MYSSDHDIHLINYINFNLSNRFYNILKSDLLKYPNCLLTKLISPDWNKENSNIIKIDKDPKYFNYIINFIQFETIVKDKNGNIALNKFELEELKVEADYFNLNELVAEIDSLLVLLNKTHIKPTFCKHPYKANLIDDSNQEIIKMIGELYEVFCVSSDLSAYSFLNDAFYGVSSFTNPNIEELLANAVPSHFGKGSLTKYDENVRSSVEIKTDLFDQQLLKKLGSKINVSKLLIGTSQKLELKPYKLVIYRPGDHFVKHRDTVRSADHVGTAIFILNTQFEGGELCIQHGNKVEKFKKPLSYAAMYGDCNHWIEPVISGIRISIIFDIIVHVGAECNYKPDKDCNEIDHDYSYRKSINSMSIERCALNQFHQESNYYENVDVLPFELINEINNSYLKVDDPDLFIALHFMYPVNQIEESLLKGNDRLLYSGLKEALDPATFRVLLTPIIVSVQRTENRRHRRDHNQTISYYETHDSETHDSYQNYPENYYKKKNIILSKEFKYILGQDGGGYLGNEAGEVKYRYLMAAIRIYRRFKTSFDSLNVENRDFAIENFTKQLNTTKFKYFLDENGTSSDDESDSNDS